MHDVAIKNVEMLIMPAPMNKGHKRRFIRVNMEIGRNIFFASKILLSDIFKILMS